MSQRDRIAFFCNPMMDISVKDASLLTKYNLDEGQAILASPEHMGLFEEAWNSPAMKAVVGGAGLNSSKSCAYALK